MNVLIRIHLASPVKNFPEVQACLTARVKKITLLPARASGTTILLHTHLTPNISGALSRAKVIAGFKN
jgi:hypothetical protein